MADPDFTALLAAQVGNEFSASQQYIAVAAWFDQETLPELAAFFYRQAVEERNHAMMLLKFQMDTDRAVRLPGVAEPRSDFADPAEPIRLALEQERRVTDQITAMATAADNAGPSRPRAWRNGPVLDGAIWAENIPFSETRDYGKKVLANTTSYAALITGTPQSLKARLGRVGPRAAGTSAPNEELP